LTGPRPAFDGFDPGSVAERIACIPVSRGLRFAIDPERPFDAVASVVARADAAY
jgi:hypothetical protein